MRNFRFNNATRDQRVRGPHAIADEDEPLLLMANKLSRTAKYLAETAHIARNCFQARYDHWVRVALRRADA